MPADTPEHRFAELVVTEPARPFVTYYDEASGERTELSVRSLGNWVAKTHHLLGDELGLGVGDTAGVTLPAHWISVCVLLGCLTAGLQLTTDTASADVAFVDAGDLPPDLPLDAFAIAPAAAALGLRDDGADGVRDYVAAVRPQGDAWAGVQLLGGAADPCLPHLNRGQVLERARNAARDAGLDTGGRLLTTRDWSSPDDWLDTFFAALDVGGSLVIVHNCTDDAVLERRFAQERATARN
ncbi:TIGR03089 family protein [uncultured Jatrophihabitans sp.]|uniref:TIGR03089 family protein n=1 Tax=uncultured Jatrophihabitans sp. TaxID=1610747 RepID=UPI0035C9AD82